jgi:GR25 family glycosyltransferase involved in LPS biosynthesis
MTSSEIGCSLSHLEAINFLTTLDGEYFMVCEDDISFKNLILFNKCLSEIINDAPPFEILQLQKIYYQRLENLYSEWNSQIYGTGCYIITKNGVSKIKKYLENKEINLHVADHMIYSLVKTIVYKYNFITTLDNDSDINIHHLDNHKYSSNLQTELIIEDFFYNLY